MRRNLPEAMVDYDAPVPSAWEYSEPCCVCGKAVNTGKAHQRLHLIDGGGVIVTLDDPYNDAPDDTSDVGSHPVGNGCIKRHGLAEYATKWDAVTR